MNRAMLFASILSSAFLFPLAAFFPSPASLADEAKPPAIDYVAPELRQRLEAVTRQRQYGDRMAAGFPSENLPRWRESASRYGKPFLATPAVEERMIPGATGAPEVKVYVINAEAGKSRPALLHMHGGGFILGTARASVADMQALALKHDCVVVSVDYRLAPETPFPGALEDNYAALKWLHDNAGTLGVDPSRIAVMGDSAGGGHAAMLAIAARDRGEIPIVAQILIYPMLDDRTGSTIDRPYWMGYLAWSPEANRFGWSSLLGIPAGSDEVPYGAVPARVENLSGLPATFIAVGSVDLFVDEDIEYARRLIDAGVPVELTVLPGGFHGFQLMAPESALAQRFSAAIDAAISRAFNPPEPLPPLPQSLPNASDEQD